MNVAMLNRILAVAHISNIEVESDHAIRCDYNGKRFRIALLINNSWGVAEVVGSILRSGDTSGLELELILQNA